MSSTGTLGRRPDAPYRSVGEVQDLVSGFEATTLPYARWTHAAHLTVAFWYLLWYGPDEAVGRVRTGLRRYNAAHPGEPMRVGYHETITRFWLQVVHDEMKRTAIDGTLADLANRLIAACADRDLPLRYYTRAHLMSDDARARRVEPDIMPMP